jgi:hypothetical protein
MAARYRPVWTWAIISARSLRGCPCPGATRRGTSRVCGTAWAARCALCGNQISDAPPLTASVRRRGDLTPSTRRCPRSCGCSMQPNSLVDFHTGCAAAPGPLWPTTRPSSRDGASRRRWCPPPCGCRRAAARWRSPVWKSKFYGAFVLNRRVDLHAIDATPARWRGDVGSSPLDGASAAASSPRNDSVKNYRVRPTHSVVDFHTGPHKCAGPARRPDDLRPARQARRAVPAAAARCGSRGCALDCRRQSYVMFQLRRRHARRLRARRRGRSALGTTSGGGRRVTD